jgi:hypothetical protein
VSIHRVVVSVPLWSVAAAQALAGAIRRKHRGRLHNRGVGEEGQLRAILSYLDETTRTAGLETGLGDGILPEEPVSCSIIFPQRSEPLTDVAPYVAWLCSGND